MHRIGVPRWWCHHRDDGTTNGAIQVGAIAKTHIDDARYYNRALEGYEIKAMTIRSNKLVAYVDTPYSYQIPATQGPTSWTTDGTLANVPSVVQLVGP